MTIEGITDPEGLRDYLYSEDARREGTTWSRWADADVAGGGCHGFE